MPTRTLHSATAALFPAILAVVAASGASLACSGDDEVAQAPVPPRAQTRAARAMGVCPPFPLRDEAGNVIDPVKGLNADVPYSPRQTCGAVTV